MEHCICEANWIGYDGEIKSSPDFICDFVTKKQVKSAEFQITAIGIYKAFINGKRIGRFEFAPGCTNYDKRLQYQTYDITDYIKDGENRLNVLVGKGWYRGRISSNWKNIHNTPCGIIASVNIVYSDGSKEVVITDNNWRVRESRILEDDLYDGETFDSTISDEELETSEKAVVLRNELSKEVLIPQEGEEVWEQEIIFPKSVFTTPNGETVIDFAQNVTGYATFSLNASEGKIIRYKHAEVLDSEGNAYTENYRSAKTEIKYICKDGLNAYKPSFTFTGFRYVVLPEKPEELDDRDLLSGFKAIAVYSHMKRTGYIETGSEKINQLFSNTLWSQRDNFLDIPTDCPQRDERMGWTGDAQVFCKTAALNYDVNKFTKKWCAELRTAQRENGSIPDTVPNFWQLKGNSAAWGDVICIMPWNMYMAYGDKLFLSENFDAMKKWVDYITGDTIQEGLWMTDPEDLKLWGKHYGDWLGLDAPEGSYIGATDPNLIASAFYAYSTGIVVKTGHILNEDVSKYEKLYENIRSIFEENFTELKTETEMVLALFFELTDSPEDVAKKLVTLIREDGYRMRTGFVGTPYLLHALSKYGFYDVAYTLLLREEYPSWLYSVNHGATSIWEHWDGVNDKGEFWSKDMNSFNHYSYGSVFDWVYTVAAGINTKEECAGYKEVVIAPHPDKRLGHLYCRFKSVHGEIISKWRYNGETCVYEIETPVKATVIIQGEEYKLQAGEHFCLTK